MELFQFKHIIFGEKVTTGGEISLSVLKDYCYEEKMAVKAAAFCQEPIDNILYILEKVGKLIADPAGIYYKTAMEKLPVLLNYSPDMVKYGLETFECMVSREMLKRRLESIGHYHIMDHFVYMKNNSCQRAMPVGTVCHVGAGNVFLGAIDSLVYGIITKNINILKVSQQDFLFPSLFMEALRQADSSNIIIPNIILTYWSRKNIEVDEFVKRNADVILLFGGEEAVVQYKQGLSAKTDLHAFGPKFSYGLVCKGLSKDELREAAHGFAADIVLWEQRACTSCQNIFIEEDGQNEFFVDCLQQSLEKMGQMFPQTCIETDAAVEICKERELAKWAEFNGRGMMRKGQSAHHTIIMQTSRDIKNSPLNRTIYVNKIENYSEILTGNIRFMKYYMSTVGVAASKGLQDIVEAFTKIGVTRFAKPGTMAGGTDPANPHDGKHISSLLVQLINTGDLPIDQFNIEFFSGENKESQKLAALNDLLTASLQSPFYQKFYKNNSIPLKSMDDIKKLPILEKQHLIEHSFEKNKDMLTAAPYNCHVFSAGGTTGKMKFVCYSCEEFRESQKVFGQGLRAVGIGTNDIVVNYMNPGAFWTGFIVVNSGLEETGCRILSMTASQTAEETIEYIKMFRPNSLIGISSNIIRLAQEVDDRKENIQFEKVFYAGEHLAPAGREFLQRVFKPARMSSFGYAAVETGPIGFQCECCAGTEHHVVEDWCHVERDIDGDILVTVLKRRLFPIIRFRVGDCIEWVEEPCKCGRTSPKFRLLGRSDDTIIMNASHLYLKDVFEVIASFSELSSFFQIIIDQSGQMKVFTIRIETKSKAVICGDIKEKIIDAIRQKAACFRDDWQVNLVKEIKVELLLPGGIEKVKRTGKIRRIIDRRMSSTKGEL